MRLTNIPYHPPARTALRDDKQFIRYGELQRAVKARAAKLAGVRCLAIALDNSVEWVLWDLATVEAKIPCVPLPPFFTQSQIAHTYQSAGISHVIDSTGLHPVTGSSNDAPALPQSTAKITFTSGSTGSPKGVCLPIQAMENVAISLVNRLGTLIEGTHLCILPLAVLLENVAGVYAGLLAGCTIELRPLNQFGENYTHLHQQLKHASASSAILVPELLKALTYQTMSLGGLPQLKFAAVGGSRVDAHTIHQARTLGLPVYEGYGLSECASVVALNTPDVDQPGSCGRPLEHVQVTLEEGEIVIQNPGFLGYVGAEHHDAFPTGDLGTIDDQGFLHVHGRSKNILITSMGRNISPEWPESLLMAQPEIIQSVVLGDGQPKLSALIVAMPQIGDEHRISVAVARVNGELPDYAQIASYKVVPPFTTENGMLTGNGRIRRNHVINHYS